MKYLCDKFPFTREHIRFKMNSLNRNYNQFSKNSDIKGFPKCHLNKYYRSINKKMYETLHNHFLKIKMNIIHNIYYLLKYILLHALL